ncbi:MAG: hypothetical protein U0165_14170 [Polyangiaceae bacterium]
MTSATSETKPPSSEPEERFSDRTGGAFVAPTLLFTPAAAVPAWTARVIGGAEIQPNSGVYDVARPLLSGEVGLGRGFTVGAGTRWVGGDNATATDGLTPFAQARYQLFGNTNGSGWVGGVSLTYKQIGFKGAEPELEGSFSIQHRAKMFEIGAQATVGQALKDGGEHDLEARLLALYRFIPELGIGAAGQIRGDIGEEEQEANRPTGKRDFDAVGGAIASATYGRWQLAALGGMSTLGLRNKASPITQIFAGAQF